MKKMQSLLLVGVLGSGGAFAAEDGVVGATSTGKFDINFTRNGTIEIKNLSDITLPQFANAAGDLIAWDNLCVDTSTATEYSISAVNAANKFELVSGTNKAEYTLHYADGIGDEITKLASAKELESGSLVTGFTASTDDCATDSSTIWVKLAKADIPSVDGKYTDTVTLTVAPE